jgi:hypothetical protein
LARHREDDRGGLAPGKTGARLLRDLFGIAPGRFLSRYHGRAPLVAHGRGRAQDRFFAALGARSIEDILSLHAGPVQARSRTLDGGAAGVTVSGPDAWRLYRTGMTLHLTRVALLDRLAEALRVALGHPVEPIAPLVFAARAGYVTEWHFDRSDTITVQLSGVKRWTLAANDEVPFPTQGFASWQESPRELASYGPLARHAGGPTGRRRTVVLRPGAVLYVPRGTWHRVETVRDALSATVILSPLVWAEALADGLRRRMLQHVAARVHARELFGARSARRGSSKAFESLRTLLREEIDRLTVRDLVPL